MKNCITDVEAVEFSLVNIKKIIDVVGKVNLVFPPYKAAKKILEDNYKIFAEALARKNLAGYDHMSAKNRKIVELYELLAASHEAAKELLREIKVISSNKKSFLKVACIL
mgnify:FL=1